MSGTGHVPHIWCTNGDVGSFLTGDQPPAQLLCLGSPAAMVPADMLGAVRGRAGVVHCVIACIVGRVMICEKMQCSLMSCGVVWGSVL